MIVLTAFGTIESAVAAMREGAIDYITKPINREELALALRRVFDRQRLVRENQELRERLAEGRSVDQLIGASKAMQNLRETITRLADADVPVLIRGESGAGKELVARALHYDSPRALSGKYVVLNCAAIPGELLESELFGHRKGSFTGAVEDRIGKFEAADNGTLFLDEIGDMPLALQAKLLRALQESEVTRVGESQPRRVNVRVLAATNQPLEERIKTGGFRQDLFYRLAVVPLNVPPLRERLDDIETLAKHFLAKHGSPGAGLSPEALAALRAHPWPGNVRELENIFMRVCALHPELRIIGAEQIMLSGIKSDQSLTGSLLSGGPVTIPQDGIELEELEKKLLQAAWEQSGHNQTAGTELLGMNRQAFIYRLQKHGIVPKYGSKVKGKQS
ncbi:sigma-54-dependent Fis family transcriptional regulator [Candidatus Sumerlaeota bacterium]|nr:sigma-54-dependent Fis family transcriptional regulator [Candidatus Sumerlaeota bacterium]